jgi:hypothetical protein
MGSSPGIVGSISKLIGIKKRQRTEMMVEPWTYSPPNWRISAIGLCVSAPEKLSKSATSLTVYKHFPVLIIVSKVEKRLLANVKRIHLQFTAGFHESAENVNTRIHGLFRGSDFFIIAAKRMDRSPFPRWYRIWCGVNLLSWVLTQWPHMLPSHVQRRNRWLYWCRALNLNNDLKLGRILL